MEFYIKLRGFHQTRRGAGPAPDGISGVSHHQNGALSAAAKEASMFEETKSRKANLGFRWIRSTSGSTYLCSGSQYSELRHASDEMLKETFIDESLNPQND